MYAVNKDPEISMEEFSLFRDYIHERAGIYFADNKMYLLKNRLAKRIQELNIKNYKDYFYRVKYDVTMKEFYHLMNLVTTNETSFYRNPPQLKSYAEEVLPTVVKEKLASVGAKTLKIWSAGCSTGEEPYTLAILILEFLRSTSGWNIEIIASDISEDALAAARKGCYTELSLRTTPPEIIKKYFTPDEGKYIIKPEIKTMVRFGHLNLYDSRKLSMFSGMDFIFCRNVMIYFSDEVKKQVVRGFYNALRPGGYLYIGHSESLHGISKAFKLVYFRQALVYHKEPKGGGSELDSADNKIGALKAIELLKQIKPVNAR